MNEGKNSFYLDNEDKLSQHQSISINIEYHFDKFESKQDWYRISARRGKDDRPTDYSSKEKIRKLNDRRKAMKNVESLFLLN